MNRAAEVHLLTYIRSMLYKQHPYKQQLVIAVKFYILLLKSKNKQHTKKRLV